MSKLMLNLEAQPNTHTHTHEAQYSWIRPKTTFGQKRQPHTYQKTLTKKKKKKFKAQQHTCIRV